MSYDWSASAPEVVELQIPLDRPIYFLSDIHLGDGGPSDIFMGKDRAMLRLLEEVREQGARLVICGDFVDFHQAWNMTRILQAHGKLLRVLSDLADKKLLTYIYGNHDHDIRIYRDILRFDVCSQLKIGDRILATHGHVFDPFIGKNLHGSHLATLIHHGLERWSGCFYRMPISDFYNGGMRLAMWMCYYLYWQPLKVRNRLIRTLGFGLQADRSEFLVTHWVKSEAGDPVGMTRPALKFGKQEGLDTVICGHSHMPGNLVHEGVRYVNTGSWTFQWAQYTTLKNGEFRVRDWISGREYKDELYQPLLRGELDQLDFDRWWRNQYMGWLRFRSGEARRLAKS